MLQKGEAVVDLLVDRARRNDAHDAAHSVRTPDRRVGIADVSLSRPEGNQRMADSYAEAGVDTAAGDLAVELMKSAVAATHGRNVIGGVGGGVGGVLGLFLQIRRAEGWG